MAILRQLLSLFLLSRTVVSADLVNFTITNPIQCQETTISWDGGVTPFALAMGLTGSTANRTYPILVSYQGIIGQNLTFKMFYPIGSNVTVSITDGQALKTSMDIIVQPQANGNDDADCLILAVENIDRLGTNNTADDELFPNSQCAPIMVRWYGTDAVQFLLSQDLNQQRFFDNTSIFSTSPTQIIFSGISESGNSNNHNVSFNLPYPAGLNYTFAKAANLSDPRDSDLVINGIVQMGNSTGCLLSDVTSMPNVAHQDPTLHPSNSKRRIIIATIVPTFVILLSAVFFWWFRRRQLDKLHHRMNLTFSRPRGPSLELQRMEPLRNRNRDVFNSSRVHEDPRTSEQGSEPTEVDFVVHEDVGPLPLLVSSQPRRRVEELPPSYDNLRS